MGTGLTYAEIAQIAGGVGSAALAAQALMNPNATTAQKVAAAASLTGTVASTAGLDDDRSVAVTAYGPVNEGSTYAMFKVEGVAGATMDLALQGASSGTAASTTCGRSSVMDHREQSRGD